MGADQDRLKHGAHGDHGGRQGGVSCVNAATLLTSLPSSVCSVLSVFNSSLSSRPPALRARGIRRKPREVVAALAALSRVRPPPREVPGAEEQRGGGPDDGEGGPKRKAPVRVPDIDIELPVGDSSDYPFTRIDHTFMLRESAVIDDS